MLEYCVIGNKTQRVIRVIRTIFIISDKEVMFNPASVCLFVYLSNVVEKFILSAWVVRIKV